MAESLSKKQIKELRKLEKLQQKNLEKKNDAVKWFAIGFVCVIFLALFFMAIIIGKNRSNPQTASGQVQFSNTGHIRMLNRDGTDADVASLLAKPNTKIVTMVEYGDIACPACKAYQPLVKQVLQSYPGQLKLIFKNFPLKTVHKNAMTGAIAAEAAGRQGKYFQYVDMAYDKQESWGEVDNPDPILEGFAKDLNLNLDQFKKDEKDPAITNLINSEEDEGVKNGVNATPTFFVDGQKIENPTSLDDFKKIINEALKNAPESNPQSQNQVSPQPSTASGKLPLQ
jgi:protein-disulfide isomerase